MTNAPPNKGLAHYYYLAFQDVLGIEKVEILPNFNRNYQASLLSRGFRRLKSMSGLLSLYKYEQVMKEIKSGKNLIIIFNGADFKPTEIEKLSKEPSIFLIQYLSDHPFALLPEARKTTFDSLRNFDVICTFASDLIPVYYQLGAKRVLRIPFGYCKYTHLESSKNIEIEYPQKVYYLGTRMPILEDWIAELLDFDLEIEGNQWHKAGHKILKKLGSKSNPQVGEQMAVMARKAGVVVNFTRAQHGCFHTMKTFELAISRACVVSNYSKEQEEFFPNGQGYNYFNTKKKMKDKVRLFLEDKTLNLEQRELIYQNALNHSYHHRVKELLQLL